MEVGHSFWADDGSRRRVQEDQKGIQDHKIERIVIILRSLKN